MGRIWHVIALLVVLSGTNAQAQGLRMVQQAKVYERADLPYLGPGFRAFDQATFSTGLDVPLDGDCPSGQYRDGGGWGDCADVASLATNPVYVDCGTGDDGGAGTVGDPLLTLSAAQSAISAGDWIIGTGACAAFSPSKNLTLAAASKGSLVISGFIDASDAVWTQVGATNEWTTTDPVPGVSAGGNCPSNVKECRENIRVNAGSGWVVLKQRRFNQSLSAGEFRASGEGTSTMGDVYIMMPDLSNPNNAQVEISQENKLFFASDVSGGCSTSALTSVHLLGVVFEGGSSRYNEPAVCLGSDAGTWTARAITANYNRGIGAKMVGAKTLVRESVTDSNGIGGLDGTNCDGCLWEYSVTRHNSYQQGQPAGHGGGGKWTRTDGSIIRYIETAGNRFHALWHDVTGSTTLYLGIKCEGDAGSCVFIERGNAGANDSRRFLVINSIARNIRPTADNLAICPNSCGETAATASFKAVNIDSSLFAWNTSINGTGGQMYLADDSRGDSIEFNHIYNNVFVSGNAGMGTGQKYGLGVYAQNATDAATQRYGGNVITQQSDSTNAVFGVRVQHIMSATNSAYRFQTEVGDDGSILVPITDTVVADTSSAMGFAPTEESSATGVAVPLPLYLCSMFGPWNPCQIARRDYDGRRRALDAGAAQYTQ